jgi:hypothetical protein
MKENDCYNCPHRRKVTGSAHSKCTILGEDADAMQVGAMMQIGMIIQIEDKDGRDLIEFDGHGIKNGWCAWPINFDPIWVTCRLPINDKTEQP